MMKVCNWFLRIAKFHTEDIWKCVGLEDGNRYVTDLGIVVMLQLPVNSCSIQQVSSLTLAIMQINVNNI